MYLPRRTDRHQACLIHISQKSGCYTVADKVGPVARIPRWGGSASLDVVATFDDVPRDGQIPVSNISPAGLMVISSVP